MAIAAALFLVLGVPLSARAGAGLPRIAAVEVGGYEVAVHATSPRAAVGTNQLTVAVPNLPAGLAVRLSLTGPDGPSIPVPLRQLRVLGAGGHADENGHGSESGGGSGHSNNAPATPKGGGNEHGMAGHDMSTPPSGTPGHGGAQTGDSHGDSSSSESHPDDDEDGIPLTDAYLARGKVRLAKPGVWQALVEIAGLDGAVASAAVISLPVTEQGPNRPFLAATSLLMVGSLITGIAGRRRQPPTGGKPR